MKRAGAWLLIVLLSGCRGGPAPEPAASGSPAPVVQVAAVQQTTVRGRLELSAVLQTPREAQAVVSPAVAGILDSLRLHVGDHVVGGQEIAHLQTRSVEAVIAQAQAQILQGEVAIRQAEATALSTTGQTQAGIAQAAAAVATAQANAESARATLEGNRAALLNARQNLDRLTALKQDGIVSTKDLQAAELAVRSAEAQVRSQEHQVEAMDRTVESQRQVLEAARAGHYQEQAKRLDVQVARAQVENARAALAAAEAQLALYTLRAPLTGIVTALGAREGEAVDTSTKLVTIADPRILQAQIAVPAAVAALVQPGLDAECRPESPSGTVLHTRIEHVVTQLDATANTAQALAPVPNPDGRLSAGVQARMTVLLRPHPGLLVPRAAIFPGEGDTYQVLVVQDGVVHARPVRPGAEQDGRVEVQGELKAADQVVTTGGYGLGDGQAVTVSRP